MATKKEVLDEMDDDLRKMKAGIDATKEWANVTARIADALEHASLVPTLAFCAAQGKEADVYISGHRIDCPSCTMIRKARDMTTSNILRANGAIKKIG